MKGADDLDFDDFDKCSGEWSGLGAGLDLLSVASEEKAKVMGTSDDEYSMNPQTDAESDVDEFLQN